MPGRCERREARAACSGGLVEVSLRASAFSSRCAESSNQHVEARAPGEVTEWPKVHDWKSCVPARVPRVRIPPSPLVFPGSAYFTIR
jgi:hypothetical protein